MSITEKMRKVFDACTVMAGVEPDFECVYMTKGAALLYLDEIDAENAKLREQIHWLKQGDILHVLTDQEYIDQCERERLMQVSIDALDKENAKLRELIRELFRDFANADYELKSRCGRTFMAVTRYLSRLQELGVDE